MPVPDVPVHDFGKGGFRMAFNVFAQQGNVIHVGHLLDYLRPMLKLDNYFVSLLGGIGKTLFAFADKVPGTFGFTILSSRNAKRSLVSAEILAGLVIQAN